MIGVVSDWAASVVRKVLKDLEEPTHEAYRERAASAVYVGSIGLHKLLQEDIPVQGQAPHVLTHFRTALNDKRKKALESAE
jgi:hypothetical protein